MKIQSVAIIGGGISGLSVAYTLREEGFEGDITVFEASATLGGNAATAEVVLGKNFRRGESQEEFTRLADLGVNDINLTSYEKLSKAMEKVGYYPAKDTLRPLEDTVSFFTPGGEEIWTKDSYLGRKKDILSAAAGVVDTRFSLSEVDPDLEKAEKRFMDLAAKDFAPKKPPAERKQYWNMSTAEYVEYFREQRLDVAGISSDQLDQLVRLFLMPRIAAMYFSSDHGPEVVPMRGVMSYYRLQEGIDEDEDDKRVADRRYFTYGSQHWIQALGAYLEGQNVKFRINFRARVTGEGEHSVRVYREDDPKEAISVDAVVMAAHADHQLQAFATDETQEEYKTLLSEKMASNLGRIEHSVSQAVAHTWSGVLPPNVGSWRTYNVMIREGVGLRPYQMTYVQNRHRNDRFNDDYNAYGMPVYFVSLNPQMLIPDKYVLRTTRKETERRLNAPPGYAAKLSKAEAERATATFRHTVMTHALLEVQDDLHNHQGKPDPRVYFAGCWTRGAGLHEECFEQAKIVAEAMLKTE